MPSQHAILSASSSHRWIACTPSARLEARVPDQGSAAAAEGTVAHAKAEEKLRNYLEGHPRKKVSCPNGEMDEATDNYKRYVLEILNEAKKKTPDALIAIEQKIDFSAWVPEGFGTADAVIIADGTMHVIDLKYGKGVPVYAENNPQLRLYALGCLDYYDDIYDIDTVKTHIFQPRLDSISTEEITASELTIWAESVVKPAAEQAFEGKGRQVPGDHCRFCKVKAHCKERARLNQEILEKNKELDAMLLTNEEISVILRASKEIQSWCKDIEEFALSEMVSGEKIPGWKLVEGRSNRKITDPDKLIGILDAAGYKEDDYLKPREPVAIGKLEKLVGKKHLEEIQDGSITKPPGSPTLAPEEDPRPALNDGAEDFAGDL